jgi:threonyl-tRNA synthetase
LAEYDAEASSDPLYVLRHSTAHVLAAAVTQLYPGTKYAGGPPVDNGFYYDFDLPRPIGEDDLPKIEQKMREIINRRVPFEQILLPHEEAVARFQQLDQPYKLHWVTQKASPNEVVSCYQAGEFFDLCRGPHVADSGQIRAFKLMRVAGAYWLGDEKNKQLTRVYGTAWPSKDELQAYLERLEEAERRDHKRLGKELDLFALDPRTGVGLPLWMPAGATIRRELERWIVDEEVARGYQHVITPEVAKLDLYKQSGHWERYHDTMFPPMEFEDGEELELRPMNCPHHILVYSQHLHSYRDLPLRIAELGQNWRYEKSGELAGLIRVRSFTLNDAHIFCTMEQLEGEILRVMELAQYFMDTLGVKDIQYRLSIWDADREHWLGSDEQWESAIAALRNALEKTGKEYYVGEGEAAFYGPKIDYQIHDALGREFTNNTIQVDFQLPERFDLEYVAEDGSRKRPVMVHRGAFGSMERMFAYLIEKYAGAFPTWLHPTQVVVIPITDSQIAYAEEVAERLRRSRLRVEVDARSERMNRKIREAQARKVPYMAVVGARESESGQVSVRNRAGEQTDEPLEDFAQRVAQEVVERRLGAE